MDTRKIVPCPRLLLSAAALFTVLLAAGTSAAADPSPDGRTYWSGRGIATGTLYCYIHRGRHWAMTMYCTDKTLSIDGVEVARCGDFIELEFHGIRDRLYSNKLLTLSKSGSWIPLARGKWGELPIPIPPSAPQPVPPGGSPPGERVHWSGQDQTGARFSFDHAGRYWNMLMTSERKSIDAIGGTEVRRCDDFIELRFSHASLRLCKDKLLTLSDSGPWTELARGKWGVLPPGDPIPAPQMIPLPKPDPAPGDPIPRPKRVKD